jgi:hypothetical protein
MKLYGLTDGVSNAWMGHLSGNIREQGNTNSKIFINNTNYLHIAAPNVAEYACYSGIQIK